MTYPEWVMALRRAHRASRGHGQRHSGCWVCDVLPSVTEMDRERCLRLSIGAPGTVNGFDGHHVLPKQVLKREVRWPIDVPNVRGGGVHPVMHGSYRVTLDEVLVDVRVGVPLRRWHHDQWENRRLHVPRRLIPVGVEEVALELGLDWWLDRTFGTNDRRTP